jgi:hypothetical protein
MAEDTEPVEQTPSEPQVVRASRSKQPPVSDEIDAANVHASMKAYFDAQKRVSIKTREDERVQINDYIFIIKGGERVDVPEDVALILEQAGRI